MSELKRHMGLFQLTMYGVGLTLGAGIYVLIGELQIQQFFLRLPIVYMIF